MPKKIYDFRCSDNHITEMLVESDTTLIRCKECGLEAKRIISPVMSMLDPLSGHFPDATANWAKHHEQQARTEEA